MNPFSKRIHHIKNPDLDLPKGTRNSFLDLKSVFGFTERNTPFDWSLPLNYSSRVLIISKRERTSSTHKFYCSYQKITKLKKKNIVQRVMYTSHKCLVIKGNFIKLLNKKFIYNTNTTKNNQMINILITGSHHTCTNRA